MDDIQFCCWKLKVRLLLLLLVFSTNCWSIDLECGRYKVFGKIIRGEKNYFISANEFTSSNYIFNIPDSLLHKLITFYNKNVLTEIEIGNHKLYTADILKIISAKRDLQMETQIYQFNTVTLIEKTKCSH